MAERDLEFFIEGPGAPALAEELSELIQTEFGHSPGRSIPGSSAGTGEPERLNPTAIAAAALIVSLPGAAVATLDLAQRLKLREKCDRLIAWAGEKAADGEDSSIRFVKKDGRWVLLREAESKDLLESVQSSGEGHGPSEEERS